MEKVRKEVNADITISAEQMINIESLKEMIFEKLGAKAKEYGANAVIGADYIYVPAYASFSTKATVSAKGTMVIWKQK